MWSLSSIFRRRRHLLDRIAELEQNNALLSDAIKEQTPETADRSDAERLNNLIGNLTTGILLEDENRRLLIINRNFCHFFSLDLDPSSLIGLDCSKFAYQVMDQFEDPAYFISSIDTCLLNKEKELGLELRKKDGSILLRDYIPIFSNGAYRGHLWQYKDVTEERRYQNHIQESEEKYRGIMENMALGLMEVDNENNIVKVYDRFAELLDYSKEELIGKNAIDFLLPTDFKAELQERTIDRMKGISNAYEVQLLKKGGERIWVLVSGAPIYDSEGKITGSIGIHYDISEQKKLLNDLELAKNEAERARMAEVQFLANMSHEIRNPINAIAGLTNLMYDTPINHEQLEYLDTIKFSSEVLMSLISDILDINKIESGEMSIHPREINIAQQVKAIVNTFRFNSRNKNLVIDEHIDPELKYHVLADPTLINQVLMNLIGNAIKFTQSGSVNVFVSILAESESECKLQIKISDTGIGIAPDELEHIFSNFKQAGPQIKEKFGGTGLGLAISKKLVQMMEGEIWVDSVVDQGSNFYLLLPLLKGSSLLLKKEHHIERNQTIKRTIKEALIVEDNIINQNYLKGILNKHGIFYKIANNGKEAIAMTELYLFDLILMDIRMPEMNGFDATLWIRSQTENLNNKVPIIALTASALVDERDKALQVGMNEHLSKPFTESRLIEVINQVVLGMEAEQESIEGATLHKIDVKQLKENQYQLPTDFDQNLLADFYSNDLEHLFVVFEHFCQTIDLDLLAFKATWDQHNTEEMAKILHKIKPNFSFVGFEKLGQLASELENSLNQLSGNIPSDLQEKINILHQDAQACKNRVAIELEILKSNLGK